MEERNHQERSWIWSSWQSIWRSSINIIWLYSFDCIESTWVQFINPVANKVQIIGGMSFHFETKLNVRRAFIIIIIIIIITITIITTCGFNRSIIHSLSHDRRWGEGSGHHCSSWKVKGGKETREDAKVSSKIRSQTSDDFRTPEERIRRTGSDDQVSLVQIASASPAPSPASSETSGAVISSSQQHNFLKSPASTSNKVIPNPQFNKRVQESKEMKILRQLQEKYDDQILNQDEKTSLAQKTMSWKEFGKMGGRPSATAREELRGLAGHKRSNRKGHLESRKKDFTAYQKMKIVEGINQKIDRGLYQDQGDKKFWPSEAKKLRISSERLKDIMARKSEWVLLVQKHQVSTRGKRQRKKDSKRQRASGGGRKREFQPRINELKDWLHRER